MRSVGMTSCIFGNYKNSVIRRGCHPQKLAGGMAMDTICIFTIDPHDIPHWKCVLRCCAKYTDIVIPGEETNKDDKIMCPKRRVNVYIVI